MRNKDLERKYIVDEIKYLQKTDPIKDAKRFTWNFRRNSMRDTIRQHNGDLSTFYHWPVMRAAFITGKTDDTEVMLDELREPYKSASIDPPIGGLDTATTPKFTNPLRSGTYIRQAYVCQRLADAGLLAEPAGKETIFEFGGGFGALACVLSRLGQQGLHTIYDYPEASLVQRWYHSELELENVLRLSNIDELSPEESHYDTYVSICALDEAIIPVRKKILSKFQASNYFIVISGSNMIPGSSTKKTPVEWFNGYFDDLGYEVEWPEWSHPGQALMIARA